VERTLRSETHKGKVFNVWLYSILIVDNLEIFIQDEHFTYYIYSITKDILNILPYSYWEHVHCTEIKNSPSNVIVLSICLFIRVSLISDKKHQEATRSHKF